MKIFTNLFYFGLVLIFTSQVQAQNLVYTQDFAEGMPSGWTTDDPSGEGAVFTWCNDPMNGAGNGCPAIFNDAINEQDPFQAETSGNGFMTMDSDAVGQVGTNHISQLTSEAIDFSAQEAVWFTCQTHIGVYTLNADENAILRVSTDMENWTNYELFPLLDTGERWSDNPATPLVNISETAAGQATVFFQFQWTGNYEYFWNIDDIEIFDADPRAEADLQVDNFFAVSPNFMTPISQVEPIYFLADVSNQGSQDQSGVVLNVDVVSDGSSVFMTDYSYGNIEVDSTMENQLIPETFTPPAELNLYDVTYSISGDNLDEINDNDSKSYSFIVSDTMFQKVPSITRPIGPATSNWEDGDNFQWAYGNHYHVENGDGLFARYIQFSLDEEANNAGENIFLSLYTVNNAPAEAGNWTPDDRTRLGFAVYEVTGTEDINDIISVLITDLVGDAIALADDTNYLVMVEFPVTGTPQFNLGAHGDSYFNAMTLATEEAGVGRYSQVLGLGNDIEQEDYSRAGFGDGVAPFVNLSIGDDPLMTIDNNNIVALPDNVLKIGPNPASSYVDVSLNFESASNVEINILDLKGHTLVTQNLQGVTTLVTPIDISKLSNGTYFVSVKTKDGSITKQLVKVQ